ncbi:hypothetical protein ACHAXN_002951 [Cyclotella atomus]
MWHPSSMPTGCVATLDPPKSAMTMEMNSWGRSFKSCLSAATLNPSLQQKPTARNPWWNVSTSPSNFIVLGDRWQEDINILSKACARDICTTVPLPSSMPYNPSQLTFGMDMIFWQKVKID